MSLILNEKIELDIKLKNDIELIEEGIKKGLTNGIIKMEDIKIFKYYFNNLISIIIMCDTNDIEKKVLIEIKYNVNNNDLLKKIFEGIKEKYKQEIFGCLEVFKSII